MQLFVFSRHGESTLNVARCVNGDPAVPAPLTEAGREAATRLGAQIAGVPVGLCVHTRFGRTRETAELALTGRGVPFTVEPLLDDIDVGDLDGVSIDEYRAWKREHTRHDAFPGGESLDDAARRYARAFRRLLERPEQVVRRTPFEGLDLVAGRERAGVYETALRYALNAAGGADDLDGPAHLIPNAVPYLFDEAALARAAARIDSLVGGAQGT